MASALIQSGDVFLSYNKLDVTVLDEIRGRLNQRGIRTFLDHTSLRPGLPWPQALEESLKSARTVAVFLGPHGLGGWQRREVFFALDLQVAAGKEGRAYPVIPVLLQGADPAPSFLMLNSFVDLRSSNGLDIDLLAAALAGTTAAAPIRPADLHPYMGLSAFREEDSGFFFGRDAFVERLLANIDTHSVVAAVGPSGSGKSSVVFAGLVPRLRTQRPPGRTWEVAGFSPGRYPWRRMADALAPLLEPDTSEIGLVSRAGELERELKANPGALASVVERVLRVSGGSNRLLLIVDQFEELFTVTTPEDQTMLIKTLLEVSSAAPISILLTLRADFYGTALASSRALSDLLGQATVPLGPLLPEELREVIERPAFKVGAKFESGLVDLIIEDVLRQPSQLPLLQYALTEIWSRSVQDPSADGGITIALNAYRTAGELGGAIAHRAEELFNALTESERKAARRLFGLLVQVGNGPEESAPTRRRARQSEVDTEGWAVARRFADREYRLLVIAHEPGAAEATVEVAHEAIIHHWTRLNQWVKEDRAALVVEQQVASARTLWEQQARQEAYLLEGPSLTAAAEWADANWDSLGQSTREFLIRSLVRQNEATGKWIRRYSANADVAALGREYFQSSDAARRRRGLDIFRWIPEEDQSASEEVLEMAITDPIPALRRYAVETLCGRRSEWTLKTRLEKEPKGPKRQALLQAIGHARNVRGVGRRALDGLKDSDRLASTIFAALDLLSLHRTAFALSFALTSLGFTLGWDIASGVLSVLRDALTAIFGSYSLTGAFFELSCVLTVSLSLFALLRSIIDGNAITSRYILRTGVIAACISEAMNIIARFAEELVRLGVSPFTHNYASSANLLFPVTDQLPIILAMSIFAFAAFSAGTMAPGKTMGRRFVWTSAFTAVAALVVGRLLIPLGLNLLGLHYQWREIPLLLLEVFSAFIISTAAGAVALAGFRVALRISFGDRTFPSWPVSTPTMENKIQSLPVDIGLL